MSQHGVTPVFMAAANGHTEALRLLVDAKGDPNAANKVRRFDFRLCCALK